MSQHDAELQGLLQRLGEKLAALDAEALLVKQPANVRYLSHFSSPEDGWVLVYDEQALLITDGRYIAQAQQESRLETAIIPSQTPALRYLMEHVGERRLAFEADVLSYETVEKLTELASQPLIPSTGLVAALRLCKSPRELEAIRRAANIADRAFSHILDVIHVGQQEVEVALELERFMRMQGAEAKSFDIIVASGLRSAMPHGVASSKTLAAGELITLDFGAVVDGYCSDMTRTIALGTVSDALQAMYAAVLEAQESALAALAPGKSCQAIDAVARECLQQHGLAEHFSHGLGHGVGLDIHEAPRLSYRSDETLQSGMVVTVEPGVYIPGNAGVRIEDLAVIHEGGFERLSHSDKQLLSLTV